MSTANGAVIVTDNGFGTEHWNEVFTTPETLVSAGEGPHALDLPADARPHEIAADFDRLALIRIRFESFADGRGLTLARQLRRLGYRGRLRAAGHVIADQYPMARASGFDEIEIGSDLARRQPAGQWMRDDFGAGRYQERLRSRGSRPTTRSSG